ncbi:hypothetical protein JTB14_009669 [Gonioctena quinquepunctata]|nr:hypothetical protein JTB14_009669 [Gonioctena quinquepunctata]
MNISFTKLGNEECEICKIFINHSTDHSKENLNPECSTCNGWSDIARSNDARNLYKTHANTDVDKDHIYYSCDLQKVIMLPRMEGFKTTVFTKRIVAFNESFVPLGTNSKHGRPIAVIWHEAICGRKKQEIISSFDAFFKHFRDIPNITLWLDNCSAQNKNWCLMTYLVHIINSSESATQTIELYFFEPGHTFMSADSFHHQVELSLSRHGKVYDFSDFENAVGATCSGKTVVKSMQHEYFAVWPSCVSNYKLNKFVTRPYLNDLVYIKAERGKDTLLYRLCYDEYCPLQELMTS